MTLFNVIKSQIQNGKKLKKELRKNKFLKIVLEKLQRNRTTKRQIKRYTWPKPFKKEYHIPINKVPQPKSEDDLRNLGLTPFLSKRLEWFLIRWIWPYIAPHIDLDQLGGLPGCSVEHYLILMLDFIHKNLDMNHKSYWQIQTKLVNQSKQESNQGQKSLSLP